MLAVPHGREIVVVGQSLDDRDETLAGLARSFAVGGPIAVLVVTLLGYALAAVGLRPVEAMRARAAGISLDGDPAPLPLPAARDEVRRLGETLNAMLDRLRRSYDRERRFVADASHELRTPIAVIKAELEGALRRRPADPDVREALTAAVDECDHLAQLAEDLLVLARAGDGALPVRPRRLEAVELLEGVRLRFAARAAEHGREIGVEAPEGLALHADEQRLGQALGNLVDNALRHGVGEITLRARAAPARSSSRSPTRVPASRRSWPGARSSASRAATRPAPAAAPGSASRSCARSRRRTAAARSSPAAPPCASGCRLRAIQARGRTLPPCQRKEVRHEGQAQGRADRDRRDRGARRRAAPRSPARPAAAAATPPTRARTETPITGSALDRASQVALKEVGSGKVTQTEAGDEEGAYEVEVTKADGSQVDVHLDKSFAVLDAKADKADSEQSDGDGETNDDSPAGDGDGETND